WRMLRLSPPLREPCSSRVPGRNAVSSTESRIVSAGLRLRSCPSLQSILWSHLDGAGFSTFSEPQACYGRQLSTCSTATFPSSTRESIVLSWPTYEALTQTARSAQLISIAALPHHGELFFDRPTCG